MLIQAQSRPPFSPAQRALVKRYGLAVVVGAQVTYTLPLTVAVKR